MANKSIQICHTVSSLATASGGPARTVSQLANHLAAIPDINLHLLSQQLRSEPTVELNNPSIVYCLSQTDNSIIAKSGLLLRSCINNLCLSERPYIIHNHGIWLPANHWPAVAARRFKIPLVLHPRGMLEPWAINHHALKKKMVMALFQKRDIETAAVIMATSHDEYKNIRALGFTNPIAVIPNGIVFDQTNTSHVGAEKKFRTVLFLSRIHPKKGLFNLINAWAMLKPVGWKLIIAGPDDGGHQADVMRLIHDLSLADNVSFIGEVDGIEKRNTYLGADLFVLPTFSENFGVVVAEALSYGVPVITTKGTPWQDLETYNCGWWVDIGVEPLTVALRDAISLSDEQRHRMGEEGKHYVQRYNWQDIAEQTADVYRWILGDSKKPSCVYLD